jgi:hypothetical protein
MANDVTMFSNPLVVLIEDEELEGAPLDVNVSQQALKKKK